MVHLARHHNGNKVTRAEEIAEKENIPLNFLAQILHELKRSGFVSSRRGKTGGWLIATPPEQLSLLDIVNALEPDILRHDQGASGESAADVSAVWQKIREQTTSTLSAATLDKVASSNESPMYFI